MATGNKTIKDNYILLWQNPNSPDTTFPSQTVMIDFTPYKRIAIWVSIWGGVENYVQEFNIDTSHSNNLQLERLVLRDTWANGTSFAASLEGSSRGVDVQSDRIIFGHGEMAYAGRLYKDWDGRCVPLAVYGVVMD